MKTKTLVAIATIPLLATSINAGAFTQTFSAKPYSKHSSYYRTQSQRDSERSKYTRKYFLSAAIINEKAENMKIFNTQPISELVGEGGNRQEFKFGGVATSKKTGKDSSRIFLYYWNTPDKNNEKGFGIGGEMVGYYSDLVPNLGLYFGGQAGLGSQSVKGDTTQLSTSVNKLTYVTDKAVTTPTAAVYTDDTETIDIALTLGSTYNMTETLFFDLAYVLRFNSYQVSYVTSQDSSVLNNITFDNYSHGLKASINYKF